MRELVFELAALEDLQWWVQHDRKKAVRVLELVQDVQRDPFTGKGKPEPLKHELAGCWARRIDQEHRLVYEVQANKIRFLACRYHY